MDIKKAEDTIDKADSFLTKLKLFLKKHWGILTLLAVGYFFYWAFTTDFEEEQPNPTQTYTEPYLVDEYLGLDEYGDTIVVYVWSDGVETTEDYYGY